MLAFVPTELPSYDGKRLIDSGALASIMVATAQGYVRGRATFDAATDGAGWWTRRRARRLERRLIPVEAQFFDAYCRGGARQHERLAVDYAFTAEPPVRAILREAAAGAPLDATGLEAEYLAWEREPDLAAFRANVAYLAKLVGR